MTQSKMSLLTKGILLIIGLTFVVVPTLSWSYNKSWDQGHKVCVVEPGTSNWGKFDDSGVFHGGYSSKECCELLCKVCPVYANTGQLQKTYTDLTIPGFGPGLSITRTYNSQDWATSLLGNGWTFNFGRRLIITRNNDGTKRIGVLLKTGEKNYYIEEIDGTLIRLTSYGAKYKLIKNSDNTYTIQNLNGTVYEIREDGKIARIFDKNQNEIVFSYNSVGCISRMTNASGNYVDFHLGPNGKISSISDNQGRTISYSYDERGNLISVTDPLGNTTQYVYNANNLLTQIVDARGNVVETATYDSHEPPRISSFTEKGETYTIAYYDGRTEKTDSQGNKWTYYFNDVGVIQRVVDPLGNVGQQQLNKITSTSVDWKDDLNGKRTTYTYDAYGNISSKIDPLGNEWKYTFLAGTNLIETETNPLGIVTKYEYDDRGNQTAIIKDFGGPLESTTAYTYDSHGNQISVTDPLGNITTHEYDAYGNLVKTTDPLGHSTIYTYDSYGNKITETNAVGNTQTYAYDLMGRLLSVVDALDNTTSYSHDAVGNQISQTNANNDTTTYIYDTYNRLVQITNPLGYSTTYTYDSKDNRTSLTDGNGNITTYHYDVQGRLSSETNALGGEILYTYDAVGNLLSIADACGNTTTFTYNALNLKVSETNAADETTIYAYDAVGNQISKILPNGNTVTQVYDTLGRIVTYSDNLGIIETYTYDLAGRQLTKTDAMGYTTSYTYDPLGRTVQNIDPLGHSTNYVYNAMGMPITMIDRQGNSISQAYDALGRKISQTDGIGNTTAYTYDGVGNILLISDALGNTTQYSYDALKRLVQETYANGTVRTFSYDAVGNLISRTDQKGQITSYVYDALNRRTMIDYPGTNDSTFTYGCAGHLATANNSAATISLVYDNIYRPTQLVQNGQTVAYAYDTAAGTETITYPSGKIVKEVRDVRGLITRVEDAFGQPIVQYSYDASGRVQTKTYMNGVVGSFVRNQNGWVEQLTYANGGSQILGFEYGFDHEGNRLFSRKLHDLTNSEEYIYDFQYRLVQFRSGTLDTNNNITAPTTQTAYNLDALGNWISKTTDEVTENRIHNNMNELVSINSTALSYDENGNLTDDSIYTYAYDYENHLVKVTRKSDSAILVEYKYDSLGRRVEKLTSGVATAYYYNGHNVLEEQVEATTLATYVYSYDADEVLSMERGGLTYYYHKNSLGSVVALTNSEGNIVEQYRYDAYGKASILDDSGIPLSDSAVGNPYLFTGRRFDVESGLQYCRNRYLSYELGRWIARDPAGYIEAMNLYEYSRNNPINHTDPFGLTSIGQILDEFFSWFNYNPDLWVMPQNDPYTRIVRNWAPVQGNIAQLKQAVIADLENWKRNHITSPSWVPTMSYSPDPNNGWNSLVRSPPGTDPETARNNFILYVLTGIQTDELHTSAIGSFRIIATADKVEDCRVTLNIWMYNEMSRRSFGRFANHPLFRYRPMSSQFMWWNWKEKFLFDNQGNITDIPDGNGGW